MARILNALGKIGLGIAVVSVVNSTLYSVEAGHRALVKNRFTGMGNKVLGEGFHFLIPWVQKPILYNIRARLRDVPVIVGSKDRLNVNIILRILFRPIPDDLPKLYSKFGTDCDEKSLPFITNEVLKSIVAQFDSSELISQRKIVSQRVSETLTERAEQLGLILDSISISHLTFIREFSPAVFSPAVLKHKTQQDAESARFLDEKNKAVIPAEGDA